MNKNGRLPLYYLDIAQYVGGLTVYNYSGAILLGILGLRIIYIFNFSNKSEYEWLKLIKFIKGLKVDNFNFGLNNLKDFFQFL